MRPIITSRVENICYKILHIFGRGFIKEIFKINPRQLFARLLISLQLNAPSPGPLCYFSQCTFSASLKFLWRCKHHLYFSSRDVHYVLINIKYNNKERFTRTKQVLTLLDKTAAALIHRSTFNSFLRGLLCFRYGTNHQILYYQRIITLLSK